MNRRGFIGAAAALLGIRQSPAYDRIDVNGEFVLISDVEAITQAIESPHWIPGEPFTCSVSLVLRNSRQIEVCTGVTVEESTRVRDDILHRCKIGGRQ